MGFTEAKRKVLKALAEGTFQHETRNAIDVKNELATGTVGAVDLTAIIKRCNGTHHSESPHHADGEIGVHVLKRDGWYIKFYFFDDKTYFISVHR